jgi:diadenosine tetraphosphate (Ap4A) HIT family hydrolase
MSYDSSNIFAKILRSEIPCKKVYEDAFALAFHDIHPQAPTHILVIPKGPYTTYDDFISSADDAEIVGFQRAVAKTINEASVIATGYRLISNCGTDARQEVPHYHVHILGGHDLGGLLAKP